MSARFQLIHAGPEHQALLANLLELYIHDFTEFVPKDVSEDGRFGYNHLPLYWSDPLRRPYLARLDGSWAGFALVQKLADPDVWDMAEFFVLRRYRRTGLGTEFALRLWQTCPGPWQVRVRAANPPAIAFWKACIENLTRTPSQSTTVELDNVPWHIFHFDSQR